MFKTEISKINLCLNFTRWFIVNFSYLSRIKYLYGITYKLKDLISFVHKLFLHFQYDRSLTEDDSCLSSPLVRGNPHYHLFRKEGRLPIVLTPTPRSVPSSVEGPGTP